MIGGDHSACCMIGKKGIGNRRYEICNRDRGTMQAIHVHMTLWLFDDQKSRFPNHLGFPCINRVEDATFECKFRGDSWTLHSIHMYFRPR